MKKLTSALLLMSITLLLLSNSLQLEPVAAIPLEETPLDNKYIGTIAGNQMHQYKFQNQFQFRIRTNTSLSLNMSCNCCDCDCCDCEYCDCDCDCECDCCDCVCDCVCDCDGDQLMARNMTMFLNTTESRRLEMNIYGSYAALGLTNGAPVLSWNEEQYRFRECFVLSLELNGTDPLQAELRINAVNPEARWAYYDENSQKFVIVPTSYQDGQLCTQTDHFSLWTILTPSPIEEAPVNSQYMGTIAGNQSHQFKFQNQFQFRIRTNTSLCLNMSCDGCDYDCDCDCEHNCDCDCDQIMAKNMTMFLNTTESRSLTMMIYGSHEALGLINGASVLTSNEEQYRFTEHFVLSLELNGTDPLQAELRINATNPEARWAYYDENSQKFVITPTSYQDGQLCTQTDHFSLWTILTPPTPRNETVENKFQGSIDANTTNQFTFQNQFQFQIRVNQSTNLDMECDTENVQQQTMIMNMNASEALQMRIRFNATLPEVGLYNGSVVRNTTQARYRYQDCLILNITLDNNDPIQAQLRITNELENATWAYYDEIGEEWIPVQTRYENGEWVANVTHFSIWTLLAIEEIPAETDTDITASIAGYPGIFIIGLFCVVSFVLYRRRK